MTAAPVWLFAATMFVGAGLLFWIQPLFAKLVLPLLGGAPSVWNTALVFFQAVLLAGYVYAHVLLRRLGQRSQIVVHVCVLGAAAVTLPVGVAEGWQPEPAAPPAAWLLGLLAVSLGAPFFAVSATAPLIQGWFSRTGHAHAHAPYFLYGASNLGSMLALLAFPFLLEPLLGAGAQAAAWTAGFALLVVCMAGCAAVVWRRRAGPTVAVASNAAGRPRWRQRAAWLAYTAVPSALLLGVTAHITTDIAAAPLLWVVPLTLYLLTFVIAFARRPPIPHWLAVRAAPLALLSLVALFTWREPVGFYLPLHLVVFFVLALMCHGELVRRRPAAAFLSEFYICLSLGGLVGGAFTALLAPVVFSVVVEYPVGLVLAAALLPGATRRANRGDVGLALLIVAVLLGGRALGAWAEWPLPRWLFLGCGLAFVLLVFSRRARPLGFALCVAALVAGNWYALRSSDTVWRGRSFFGVYRITESGQPKTRSLVHGTTNHGGQRWAEDGEIEPTTYYTKASPIAEMLAATRARTDRHRVGMLGLGTGALACYRRPADEWRYFEIDPLVVWIARDSGYFDFIAHCAESAPIVLGDARLTLANEPDGRLDLLIVDTFSSDAVPIHLLTREAVALYMRKLAHDGLLVVHISNRFLDLAPVVGGVAAHLGYAALVARRSTVDRETDPAGSPSHWVAVAHDRATLDCLALSDVWQPLAATDQRVWSDDFSNLLGAIRWLALPRSDAH